MWGHQCHHHHSCDDILCCNHLSGKYKPSHHDSESSNSWASCCYCQQQQTVCRSRAPACAYSAHLAKLAEAPMFAVAAHLLSHGMSSASMDTQVTRALPWHMHTNSSCSQPASATMQAPKHGILCNESTNRRCMAGTASNRQMPECMWVTPVS